MLKRIGAAVGVASGATLLNLQPAEATEPHDLNRTDTYTLDIGTETITCTLHGGSFLSEFGDGAAIATIDPESDPGCLNNKQLSLRVSYIDTSGDVVSFSAHTSSEDVFVGVSSVESDLVVHYGVTHISCRCGSPTYRLPK